MSKPTLTKHQLAGLEATYQMEALLKVLTKATSNREEEDYTDMVILARAILPRLMRLNGAAMSLFNPESDSLRNILFEINGSYPPENEVAQ